MLRISKLSLLVGWAISCFLFFEVAAHADEWNESSTITFNKAVQVPGKTLPAGTYLFKLVDSDDRHIVQVFNAKGTVLYATIMANPTERPEATGNTVVTLADQGQSEPYALVKWFYPGRTTGHEFVYPQQEQQQLAQDRQLNLVANQQAQSGD